MYQDREDYCEKCGMSCSCPDPREEVLERTYKKLLEDIVRYCAMSETPQNVLLLHDIKPELDIRFYEIAHDLERRGTKVFNLTDDEFRKLFKEGER